MALSALTSQLIVCVKVRTLSGTRAVLSQKCDGWRNGMAGKMAGSVAGGMSGGMAWLEEHLL